MYLDVMRTVANGRVVFQQLLDEARVISNVRRIRKRLFSYKDNNTKYVIQKQCQRLCRTDIASL